MATTEIKVRVQDMRWFREVSVRLSDLFAALEGEDVSSEAEQKMALLRAAINARSVDDMPEP